MRRRAQGLLLGVLLASGLMGGLVGCGLMGGLVGCVAPPQEPPQPAVDIKPLPARLRACAELPPRLPLVRTPEALQRRQKQLDTLYRDCAERLRQVVVEHDRLRNDLTKEK